MKRRKFIKSSLAVVTGIGVSSKISAKPEVIQHIPIRPTVTGAVWVEESEPFAFVPIKWISRIEFGVLYE